MTSRHRLYTMRLKSQLEKRGIEKSQPSSNSAQIEKAVYKKVMKTLGYENAEEINQENKEKKKKKLWHTSIAGGAMISTQAISSAISLQTAYASTDRAQLAESMYTATKGAATLGLSTFGGAWGMVAAVLINAIDGLIGQKIKDQIQLSYDNSRLFYNYTRYDIGRNSTFVYDNESQKWVAKDTKKVMSSVLHQNNFV